MRYSKLILVAALGAIGVHMAEAVPTAEEAAELGKSLTPLGAIRAGNKEGTIPEWTGGICAPAPGYKPAKGREAGGGPYINPFAGEKPLFKITAADEAKYADKIDEGTKEMFRRYPQTFYMNVYPSHRTACYADYVYENTMKRVMNPRIVGGNVPGLANAHAQIPFPIPKNGVEVMWNAQMKPEQPSTMFPNSTWMVDSSGNNIATADQMTENQNLYWDNKASSIPEGRPYWALISTVLSPASQVGVKQMRFAFLRPDVDGAPTWAYSPGQRRVRLAPEFSYDGVSSTSGGLLLFDEINGFDGKMDRFDFKLLGRKEMYVPYNSYDFQAGSGAKMNTPNHVDMSYVRYELHRLWVVEATLKPGERHVQKRKVFYVDEDSWNMVTFNGFDQAGKPHQLIQIYPMQYYDKPEIRNGDNTLYDFPKRAYLHANKCLGGGINGELMGNINVKPYAPNFFTAENMAGKGLR